jgi:hypothetical protein
MSGKGTKGDPKSKKIVFYDTPERHASLKVRLQHDSISQAAFFRSLVTGYIKKDPDILNFIDKIKASKKIGSSQNKKEIRESRELIKKGNETMNKLGLAETEIENIFDLLEKANPDL